MYPKAMPSLGKPCQEPGTGASVSFYDLTIFFQSCCSRSIFIGSNFYKDYFRAGAGWFAGSEDYRKKYSETYKANVVKVQQMTHVGACSVIIKRKAFIYST
jgi:hypothetical protein